MEIRRITTDEVQTFCDTLGQVFGDDAREGDLERFTMLFERDRLIAAFDGDQVVGTVGAFSFELTVPGGRLPMGATTVTAVRPSHRRRGVLTRMMRAHVDEVRSRGEPLAGLWASESGIYARFGYGMAAYRSRLAIDRGHAALVASAEPPGPVRMIDAGEAERILPEVYDRVRPTRPGMLSRTPVWWKHHRLDDSEHGRQGASAFRFAVCEDEDGKPSAYVQYRHRPRWEDALPAGTLDVEELVASTPTGHRSIWAYVLGVDLVTTVKAWNQPVDETLPWLLEDPRRALPDVSDSLWVRLVDLPRALATRRYRVPGELILRVRDPFCPWNEGTWRLEGGPDGAVCEPSDATPQLTTTAADVGALYLGGNRVSTLARAGRIAGDPEALARADLMFSWDRAPWCAEVF